MAAPWTALRLQVVDGRAPRTASAGRLVEANPDSGKTLVSGLLSRADLRIDGAIRRDN